MRKGLGRSVEGTEGKSQRGLLLLIEDLFDGFR